MVDVLPLSSRVNSELIRAAQAGDSLAMSQLLDALVPWVGRICGSIALDSGPDAAQEALIQVFCDLGELREPTAFRAWVRRIATREAVRHARRDRRSEGAATGRELPAVGDPALVADIRSVLVDLSPEQRAILVFRDLEGFSEDEAADLLEVAKGTVKSRLHRARSAFQKRWSS